MDSQTISYIQENINKNDLFQDAWTEMFSLYSKKLWHQLTLAIEKMVNVEEFRNHVDLKGLYEHLLSNFENKMNSLALARITIIIGHQVLTTLGPDAAVLFLQKIVSKMSGVNAKEASVLLMTEIGMVHLNSQKDVQAAREVIDKIEALLDDLDGVTSAHAPFFKLSSAYKAAMADHGGYYREALKYLSCLSAAEMLALSPIEKQQWAVRLCVSALLARNVYNFGELLMHEIVEHVSAGDCYLLELVRAFNEGSMAAVADLRPQLLAQADLAADAAFLEEKITLMSLVEAVFQRPANARTISFEEVAKATGVSADAVELLVMKAMAKGLLRGRIDEVAGTVVVRWVQPRVLSLPQIAVIRANIGKWAQSVADVRDLVNVNAQEILH